LAWLSLIYVSLWFIPTFILIIPIGQFLSTPLFTLMGTYTYLSPMLLVYNKNGETWDLHSGTGFDYYFLRNEIKPGHAWRKQMFAYYIDGLLEIIRQIETGNIKPDTTIKGSSYFFGERTLKKFGFQLDKPSTFERVNILLNMVDLTWMYSIAQGRFAIPNITNVQNARVTAKDYLGHKEALLEYQKRTVGVK
jgi:hypothetical protein